MLIISRIQRRIRGLSPFMINQKHLRVKALYLIPLNKCVQFHTELLISMATVEHLAHSLFKDSATMSLAYSPPL